MTVQRAAFGRAGIPIDNKTTLTTSKAAGGRETAFGRDYGRRELGATCPNGLGVDIGGLAGTNRPHLWPVGAVPRTKFMAWSGKP